MTRFSFSKTYSQFLENFNKIENALKDETVKLDSEKVASNVKIIVATYFDHSVEATKVLVNTPISAIALDFVYGKKNLESLEAVANSDKKLLVGIVDGRNIWINDSEKSVETLNEISKVVPKDRLRVGTSSSLLHTPYTLKYEEKMDSEIKSWLSYAVEKLDEVNLINKLFFGIELSEKEQSILDANKKANESRRTSTRVTDIAVIESLVLNLSQELHLKRELKLNTLNFNIHLLQLQQSEVSHKLLKLERREEISKLEISLLMNITNS